MVTTERVVFTVRLPLAMTRSLDRRASALGVSRADLLRIAAERMLTECADAE